MIVRRHFGAARDTGIMPVAPARGESFMRGAADQA
jgi:hypothetical protein